jgi:hypothetical protein
LMQRSACHILIMVKNVSAIYPWGLAYAEGVVFPAWMGLAWKVWNLEQLSRHAFGMDQLQELEAKELPCTKRFMLILPGRNPFWALVSPLNAKSCSDNGAEWHFLVQSIASGCTGVSNWSALLLSLVERTGWSDAGSLKFPANLLRLGLLAMDYVELRNASFRSI